MERKTWAKVVSGKKSSQNDAFAPKINYDTHYLKTYIDTMDLKLEEFPTNREISGLVQEFNQIAKRSSKPKSFLDVVNMLQYSEDHWDRLQEGKEFFEVMKKINDTIINRCHMRVLQFLSNMSENSRSSFNNTATFSLSYCDNDNPTTMIVKAPNEELAKVKLIEAITKKKSVMSMTGCYCRRLDDFKNATYGVSDKNAKAELLKNFLNIDPKKDSLAKQWIESYHSIQIPICYFIVQSSLKRSVDQDVIIISCLSG